MDPWTALGRSLGVSPLTRDDCSRLEFDVAGRPAVLEEIWVAFNDDQRAKTSRLRVDLRGVSPGTLKIYPEGVFFPIARLFGAQDLKIGDSLFDALYVIKATPASLAADVFGSARRARLIEAVRGLGRYMSPVVDLTRDGLQIRTSEYEVSRALLERIVAAGTELTAALLEARPSSVLIWEEPSAAAPGRCPVCGSPLHGTLTRCRTCRTPHHSECWQYAGGCSTYACGQRQG